MIPAPRPRHTAILMSVATMVTSNATSNGDDGIEVLGPLQGSFGELAVVDIVDVVAGPHHALIQTNDGSVRAAGWNGPFDPDTGAPCGQCDPPPGLGDLQALAAGTRHSMGLRVDGSVVCWGCDEAACDVPPELAGGDQGHPTDPAVAIAAGDGFSLALLESGVIACWGGNTKYEVCAIPRQAREPSNPPVRILARRDACVAILQDDTVVSWGGCLYQPGDLLPENAEIVGASLSPRFDVTYDNCPSLALLLADGRYVDGGGVLSFDADNPCVAIHPGPSTVIVLEDGSWIFRGFEFDNGSFAIPGEAGSTRSPVSLATGGLQYLLTIPFASDCDEDGVPDHQQIASDPTLDCDGDGRLDACRSTSLFSLWPVSITTRSADLDLSDLPLSELPVTASTRADGDLEARNEFLLFEWNGTPIATAFEDLDPADPCETRFDEFSIDPRIWNLADDDDRRVLTVSPSLTVDPDECGNGLSVFLDLTIESTAPYHDCNDNGIDDDCEIADGDAPDVDGDRTPDECQPDCDGDGQPDAWTIFEGLIPDCNRNGVPDDCDLLAGRVLDDNGNGIPDECETDCNGNGIPDDIDLEDGSSADVDGNAIPDECQPDCNGNGLPDPWEIANGIADDCDEDGLIDTCTVADGDVTDCNANGVPDDCDIASGEADDCDEDGLIDACAVADGDATDCNANGVPDDCETARPGEQGNGDLDGDGCVDSADLGLLLSLWATLDPICGDLDGDGQIRAGDLGILLSNWGCP